jgi:ABC-type phosphate transport system ATPase subunit
MPALDVIISGAWKMGPDDELESQMNQTKKDRTVVIARFAMFQKRRIASFAMFLHPIPTVSSRPGIQDRISQPPSPY